MAHAGWLFSVSGGQERILLYIDEQETAALYIGIGNQLTRRGDWTVQVHERIGYSGVVFSVQGDGFSACVRISSMLDKETSYRLNQQHQLRALAILADYEIHLNGDEATVTLR